MYCKEIAKKMRRNRNGAIEGRNFTGKCRLSLNPIFCLILNVFSNGKVIVKQRICYCLFVQSNSMKTHSSIAE